MRTKPSGSDDGQLKLIVIILLLLACGFIAAELYRAYGAIVAHQQPPPSQPSAH